MKKVSWILLGMCVLLAGCSRAQSGQPDNHVPPAQTPGNVASEGNSTGSPAVPVTVADSLKGLYVITKTEKTPQSDISYPQVQGLSDAAAMAKINQTLKQAAVPPVDGNLGGNEVNPQSAQVDTSYTILLHQANILEVMYSSYAYMQGAAHGMPGREVVIVDLKDGTVYHMRDLFKPGSAYLQRLSDLIRKQDTSHLLDTFQTFTGVTDSDGFYLSGGALHVYFTPYEWTPYAAGFPEFAIPLEQLTDVVNPQGILWNALQSGEGQAKANEERTNLGVIQTKGYVPIFPFHAEAPDGTGSTLYAWDARANFSADESVQKVFFFANGQYLGTDTLKAHGAVIGMTPVDKATIAVTYSTNDAGGLTIRYHWDGTRLIPDRGFPASYTDWSNH